MKTVWFLLLLAHSPMALAADAKKPMNVLFLMVDDLNTWLLDDPKRYSGKVVAPNIRRLAASGVVFRHAYAASPKCSPSRTALLSGVPPWRSGLYDNGVDIGESKPLREATALPKLFKDAGYYLASYGKIGHGWDTRKIWDDHLPQKRDPVPPNAPFLPFTRGEQDWGVTHLAESEMHDTKFADAAIKQLQKKHDRPFFLACGVFHPHMPWYVPQKYFDMFPLEDVTIPKLKENDLDDVPPLGRELTKGKSRFVEKVLAEGKHREGVRAYLATTAYADAQMGRVLDALEKSSYRDNTIVILMSDHGFHLGEKNHWQKGTLWEEGAHCLLMARVPGMTKEGGRCQRLVSLQDVYPTLTDLAALEAPKYVGGRSLVSLLKNPSAPWKSTAISAYGDRYVSIRTEKFRYIRYREDQEELYDMSKDPSQWTNEAGNSVYAGALDRHRELLPEREEMAQPLPRKRQKSK